MANHSEAILNTSPLLYLHRAQVLHVLSAVISVPYTTPAVMDELAVGRAKGLDVPSPSDLQAVQIREPTHQPERWLAVDLGAGEASVIALATEMQGPVAVLDDMQARRVASAAGVTVWGTLRVLLEAKRVGAIDAVSPLVANLVRSGMWISENVRARILHLAGE